MDWMVWTLPTAIFFGVIALLLVVMTTWELVSPTRERRGFLPISTTRGDRFFIGMLSAAYIHLAVVGFTSLSLWLALGVSVVWMLVLLRWG
ncbi:MULTISPECIES: DUF2160 domain-containing protein [Halomonas]|uniref:DUF2160 domain-containing protein n=3 Tax=Halomonas TaxID=2745 RepID=A0AAU7KC66_9GAMM|nr:MULTISPECIES: DUF2160 domain-containing protein [Halomonas]MBR9772275.1 DUF2160 domain-containing protein [Gammaproteobacteria bacterium]MAR74331.1 hypothetical protein [Halomonas sp.]MAY72383.1 hypothetical protein [Halomonas sp.]MBR9881598.1 DUF2160 domain-containing protein [Gammaproteobacteria bacterium]MBS8267232.1 hypothetical protein [Halomonas litopenaei]|tara:strand:+ start:768 stop:1040 length:273 start_codon:yes stop_codon:yes gene_type:complete